MRTWLKEARIKKKLTQQDIAQHLHVSNQQYSFLERYERQKDLNMSTMIGLSEILDMPIEQIVEYEQTLKNTA